MAAHFTTSDERAALLGLWAVPGIGPMTLGRLRAELDLAAVARTPVASWLGAVKVPEAVGKALRAVGRLCDAAEQLEQAAYRGDMEIAFAGDPAYPSLLAGVENAPPLLFFRGAIDGPRRRLAMVGSRHPDTGFEAYAAQFAREVALAGVGVVSGAAVGIDSACHQGAAAAGMPSWAFVGSALDELDPAQAQIAGTILGQGGALYSELPPGVRADRTTFPRRNRLISGASNAVLVLRAGLGSGALHTTRYAAKQGRPVLALPGEARNPAAAGCLELIRSGVATVCTSVEDACRAVGWSGSSVAAPVAQPVQWDGVSAEAKQAYEAVGQAACDFDQVLEATRLPSGALASALCELELLGLVIQRPGKRYERI